MRYKNYISVIVILIILLSLFSSITGLFTNEGSGEYELKSIHDETIKIYGRGLYKNDSISMVAQGKAQDIVTLILGIPILLISLYFSLKNSLKSRLILTGTLGYFLYTYISYVFLWSYNELFLVYVFIMSLSFFAFILTMMSFDIKNFKLYFNNKLPVRLIGGFQIFFGVIIAMLWLKRIIPSMVDGTTPIGLEHYTTLVIQGLDLGFIVPLSILSGVLIIKRKSLGYLLSSVIIIKGITMATAITAMIIGMIYSKVEVSIVEIIIFPIINLFVAYLLVLLLKNINKTKVIAK